MRVEHEQTNEKAADQDPQLPGGLGVISVQRHDQQHVHKHDDSL